MGRSAPAFKDCSVLVCFLASGHTDQGAWIDQRFMQQALLWIVRTLNHHVWHRVPGAHSDSTAKRWIQQIPANLSFSNTWQLWRYYFNVWPFVFFESIYTDNGKYMTCVQSTFENKSCDIFLPLLNWMFKQAFLVKVWLAKAEAAARSRGPYPKNKKHTFNEVIYT